jgi:translation initiation factor 2-alpha kinase 4
MGVVNVAGLGTIYLADPVGDNVNVTLQLELYTITFYLEYYLTS